MTDPLDSLRLLLGATPGMMEELRKYSGNMARAHDLYGAGWVAVNGEGVLHSETFDGIFEAMTKAGWDFRITGVRCLDTDRMTLIL